MSEEANKLEERILLALDDARAPRVRASELAAYLNSSRGAVRTGLQSLAAADRVVRHAEGTSALWSLPERADEPDPLANAGEDEGDVDTDADAEDPIAANEADGATTDDEHTGAPADAATAKDAPEEGTAADEAAAGDSDEAPAESDDTGSASGKDADESGEADTDDGAEPPTANEEGAETNEAGQEAASDEADQETEPEPSPAADKIEPKPAPEPLMTESETTDTDAAVDVRSTDDGRGRQGVTVVAAALGVVAFLLWRRLRGR